MVPPASDRVPPAPPYSGYCQVRARFAYGALTLYGPPSHAGSAARAASFSAALQPRARLDAPGLGWSPFARRYSGSHCCFPFLRLLRCFSSAGSPPPLRRMPHLPCGGLPHSGVRGSMAARASPRPFAACRALRRLREPQASPVRPYPLARRAPHRCGLSRGLARSRLRALSHALVSRVFSSLSLLSLLGTHGDRPHARLDLPHPVNEPSPPSGAVWRMWGSNPRPQACKACALAD